MRVFFLLIIFLSVAAYAEICKKMSNGKLHCEIVPGEIYMFQEGVANYDQIIKCKKISSVCRVVFENNSYSIYDSFENKIREFNNESDAFKYLAKVNSAKAC